MDTNALKKFAQDTRNQLRKEIKARLIQILSRDSVEYHQKQPIIEDLESRIKKTSQDRVIEEVAYTWFNRFCALRYMDLNRFNRIGIVSPASGSTQPEILQEAKGGYIDQALRVNHNDVQSYLSNTKPADNPQQEAYRLMLIAYCNRLAAQMPFLFERIEDYTELLMPRDLLSESSILSEVRSALTEENCQDVEVIGWLYQFYISEKKDEVMGRKGAVGPEDIPAVTQLFTPHWIVRYMVENSLGRLWLLNHPASTLAEKMEYYIKPVEAESDYLKIESPEDIRLCDPACGSGHILTYTFDLLYAIYEELGYDPVQIPALIVEKNLFGVEIDQRAGSLAAFAIYMKAYEKDRRFHTRKVSPNICVMEDIVFSKEEENTYQQRLGIDLFTQDLWEGMQQFEDASTYGSLIRPKLRNPKAIRQRMKEQGVLEDLILLGINRKVEKVLEMSEYLSTRYHVVVANPPYFGGGMDADYKQFARDYYPRTKSDTFSMFIERNSELALSGGQLGFMTPFVWMFISSYEDLRKFIIEEKTITSLVQLEYSGFEGATVPICTFTLENKLNPDFEGGYIRLSDFRGAENQAPRTLEAIANPDCGWFFRAYARNFKKLPSIPISYWVGKTTIELFSNQLLSNRFEAKEGVGTRNDEVFLKLFWEVPKNNIGKSNRWILTDKAGDFRKWFMGISYIMDWENDGRRIKNYKNPDGSLRSRPQNTQYLFKEGVTWGKIGSGISSFRWRPVGFGFNDAAPTLFGENVIEILGQLNSKITKLLLKIRGGTLNLTTGVVLEIPNLIEILDKKLLCKILNTAIEFSQLDWDSFETSWDFSRLPLITKAEEKASLISSYKLLREEWRKMTEEMKSLEEENNRIFIEAYGLQDELNSEVPLSEITLTCNPHYRYPNTVRKQYTDKEREAMLLEDTMKEFISYGVGCMFGRYSLDKPGLILTNQGETVEDYLSKINTTEPRFMPDEDNVIPILEGDWFTDDIGNRFKSFLKVTFGDERYEENLAFLEIAIGKDIKTYFRRDFYKNHIQMYKKRPIYWLFSSPNNSFQALIYMHRYTPDTISIVLKYLREFQGKLRARQNYLQSVAVNPTLSSKEQIAAESELRKLQPILKELVDYERDILFPLATERIHIDLDDGVKVNYQKLGNALASINL